MDQRFGAWAQLLALFRLIHGGGGHAGSLSSRARVRCSTRTGFRFSKDAGRTATRRFPWSLTRPSGMCCGLSWCWDGERLSYRTLDVEQIGSVYEAVMGFRVELTTGRSIAVASPKRTGAAVIVDLDSVLELEGGKRAKSIQDRTDRKLTGNVAAALRDASTVEDIVAAFDRAVDRDATPDIVPGGTPVLQPTDERRRSGSHYTPRSLTEPIVSEALRLVFKRLGRTLDRMTSSISRFSTRRRGRAPFWSRRAVSSRRGLVEAWSMHGGPPELPADEDELLHAQRLVAQRCLYGVDKNPMAIDLARLSLWLVTLARDHEFTFIDHALRHGDSLAGLTRNQIEGFHWDAEAPRFQLGTETMEVQRQLARVSELRQLIRELGDEAPEHELRELLEEADRELRNVRRVGDLILAAFFEGAKPKERESRRLSYASLLLEISGQGESARGDAPAPPLTAFHWEFEFPEVFERENPGFDAVVGNPPFAGKNTIAAAHPAAYPDWLKQVHSESTAIPISWRIFFGGRSTSCETEDHSVSLLRIPLGKATHARQGCVGFATTAARSTAPSAASNGRVKRLWW